jgi:exonuclease SbcD
LSQNKILIKVFSDTHLGFDDPIRPRSARIRRGPDFFANFEHVLQDAVESRADLVIHCGDLFYRSRLPAVLVDRVYLRLLEFTRHGIPILIVPGNHERGNLPVSLFRAHSLIRIFERPETFVFKFNDIRIGISGFPNIRHNVRSEFPTILSETNWNKSGVDLRYMAIHQSIDGAVVGPGNFMFRNRADTINIQDIPPDFSSVLAGHIHRSQIVREEGKTIVFPGSVERTSFAEMHEVKGYFDLEIDQQSGTFSCKFRKLKTRPMYTVDLESVLSMADLRTVFAPRAVIRVVSDKNHNEKYREHLNHLQLPEDAILQFKVRS